MHPLLTPTQADSIRLLAAELGFDCCGFVAVQAPSDEPEARAAERFSEWIRAGRSGEMKYLQRQNEQGEYLRGALRLAIPWARSVLVCAVNYNTPSPYSSEITDKSKGWIARYAVSGTDDSATDYHDVILSRLRLVEHRIQEITGGCESRCYVDTGPIVEREYARRAGIGWIGKNTCIMNQELGSWLYLGVIVLGVELSNGIEPQLVVDRCGTCTRCIEACPTGALDRPYEMDATKCISYLTIEKRGEIPEPLRTGIGRNVFGCDICQDVCPWNRKSPEGLWPQLQSRPELENPALELLAALDQAGFKGLFRNSPVERAKFRGFRRNIAIAMGTSGEARYEDTLESWAQDEDVSVRDAAAWGLVQIRQEG